MCEVVLQESWYTVTTMRRNISCDGAVKSLAGMAGDGIAVLQEHITHDRNGLMSRSRLCCCTVLFERKPNLEHKGTACRKRLTAK